MYNLTPNQVMDQLPTKGKALSPNPLHWTMAYCSVHDQMESGYNETGDETFLAIAEAAKKLSAIELARFGRDFTKQIADGKTITHIANALNAPDDFIETSLECYESILAAEQEDLEVLNTYSQGLTTNWVCIKDAIEKRVASYV